MHLAEMIIFTGHPVEIFIVQLCYNFKIEKKLVESFFFFFLLRQNVAYAIHVLLGAEALTDLQFWTQWLTNNIQKTHNHASKTAVENCTSALGILMLRKPNQVKFCDISK